MFSKLIPDKYVENYQEITPYMIKSMGGRAVFVDLDGTLVSKNTKIPNEQVLEWIDKIIDAGIEFVLISNNTSRRVGEFAKDLEIHNIHSARKPLHIGFRKAMNMIREDVLPSQIIMIGDQIYTDTLAAKRFGAKSIYVSPIDTGSKYTRFRMNISEPYFVKKAKEKK
ncbi:MAG: YqeG family HAD IIIA-type phosphatase [Clostridia bacterium]